MPAEQLSTTLARYVAALRERGILRAAPADADLPVSWVTCDSRDVRANTLFVCKGAAFKPEYLEAAVGGGAVAYVAETTYEANVPVVIVSDIRAALGVLANEAYSHPSHAMNVCAITGTKGKTTASYYLKSILDAQAALDARPRTPLFSTITLDDGVTAQRAVLTTPEPLDLQRHLANARSTGAREVVMEASSQALKYGRVAGMKFAVGAFLNIGEDHISPIEHPTFDDYFASKLMLFPLCETAVVNAETDHKAQVFEAARASKRTLTYAAHSANADVFAENVHRTQGGITFRAHTPRFATEVFVPTVGSYNVENALAAIACAEALGISEAAVVEGLAHAAVPGRMEVIPCPTRDVVCVIDYAHNGSELESLLTEVRESYPDRPLTVVFGATGTKGVERRIGMGKAAGRLADRLFITEDDPGNEDVRDICETIAHYAHAEGNENYRIIVDREEAVRVALTNTPEHGVLVLAGKGHEQHMLRKTRDPYEGDAALLARIFAELPQ